MPNDREFYRAVLFMESQIKLTCENSYHWAEKDKKNKASSRNNLRLIPMGDGYGLCFDHNLKDLEVFKDLLQIYKDIREKYPLRMAICKGHNYIVRDLNDEVNLIGWGINLAARAIKETNINDIICTSNFAESVFNTDNALLKNFTKFEVKVKGFPKQVFYSFHNKEVGIPFQKKRK